MQMRLLKDSLVNQSLIFFCRSIDYVKDTSDTDTKSELSDDYDLHVEYEVPSDSEEEQAFSKDSSSDDVSILKLKPALHDTIFLKIAIFSRLWLRLEQLRRLWTRVI